MRRPQRRTGLFRLARLSELPAALLLSGAFAFVLGQRAASAHATFDTDPSMYVGCEWYFHWWASDCGFGSGCWSQYDEKIGTNRPIGFWVNFYGSGPSYNGPIVIDNCGANPGGCSGPGYHSITITPDEYNNLDHITISNPDPSCSTNPVASGATGDGGDSGPPDCGGGGSGGGGGCSSCNSDSGGDSGDDGEHGMPRWRISTPNISLFLADQPLGYQPAAGPRVSLRLNFKQREQTAGLSTNIFSVGQKWNFSWLSYVSRDTNGHAVLHFPDGRERIFYGTADYLTNTRLTGSTNSGYTLSMPDGSKNVYGMLVTNSTGHFQEAFLTEQWNAISQKTTFSYDAYVNTAPVARLRYVIDGDGRTNTVYYVTSSVYSTNLISQIVDPFNRTNSFAYDPNGFLTNITDVAGISSSFGYDTNGWITNLTTPYGPTAFKLTDSTDGSFNGRSALVTQPDGGHQLYLFTNNAPGVTNSYTGSDFPNTSPFTNTFDNGDLQLRNTFHWGARQYANLSTTNISGFTANDFRLASMRHWLNAGNFGLTDVGYTVSLRREPSPDAAGSIEGEKTWFDHVGKTNTQFEGSQVLPLFVAQVLPDGNTHLTRTDRNSFGAVTNEVSTFSGPGGILLRTNTYLYSTDDIDLLAATNALGIRTVTNTYNSFHEIVTSVNAVGDLTSYTYNAAQQVTSITLPTGLITTNVYGTDGHLIATFDYAIVSGSPVYYRTNSYTYLNDLVYTHTDERGMITTNIYDNLNRLTNSSDSRGAMQYQYLNLDLQKVTDRMGFTNCFGYDSMRRKVAETNGLGFYTLYNYCTCGSLDSIRDAEGNYTYFFYNNAGRMWNTVYPDGYSITNNLDLLGRAANVIDSANYNITNWFNNQGLRYAVSTAAGNREYIDFDALDRATNTINSEGVGVASTFDDLNRVITRTYPDSGVEHFGYSPAGMIAYTNQIGLSNFFTYDPLRRKIFETNANHEILSYTYSPASDLLTLTDGKSQVTTWHYDEFGRVTNKLDQASTEILRYKYDADNRLTNRWSAQKGNTGYGYDRAGNLLAINYPLSPAINFSFDALNRRTNMVDAIGTTRYSYTPAGQLLTEDGPFDYDTVTNSYSNRLRTSLSLQEPSGVWTNAFAWDAIERLTNVVSPAGSFGYNYESGFPSHLVSDLSLPNGASITNIFDVDARLQGTALLDSTSGGFGFYGTIDSYWYTYNPANQRTNVTRADSSGVAYRYDKIGQLTVADSSVTGEDRGYTYDSAWNLNYRTNAGTLESFAVNSLNELTWALSGGFDYDLNGNLTNGSGKVYIYDDENRLIEVNQGSPFSGALRSTFAYDGLGRLRIRTEYLGDGSSWNAISTNAYIYDGMRVIQERDGANTPSVSYTRGNDLSGSMEGAGGIGGLLARSAGYSCSDSTLTVSITNESSIDCTFWIYSDAGTNVDGEVVSAGSARSFTFSAIGGVPYTIYGTDSRWHVLTIFNEWTATLDHHALDLASEDPDPEDAAATDFGSVLCSDSDTWPRHDYYFADGNGNIVTLIDTNQTVSASYRYDPFGNITSQSGAMADANTYRFSSKEFHAASGLYYYGYRFYDPNLQRWVNRDPVAERGGHNLYGFVGNSPISHVDTVGLCKSGFSFFFDTTVVRHYHEPGYAISPLGGYFVCNYATVIEKRLRCMTCDSSFHFEIVKETEPMRGYESERHATAEGDPDTICKSWWENNKPPEHVP